MEREPGVFSLALVPCIQTDAPSSLDTSHIDSSASATTTQEQQRAQTAQHGK